ncbi:hypothetical protein EV183_000806 [Coemansia sp. RSA 2336]|nr:hypothetical protein EV183_000806 [Coemansia sp. RSA 2336]
MGKFDIKSRLPIPMGFGTECQRGARIIESFMKPGSVGPDKLIPPSVLEKARGIAFLSVIKGGFVWSGRIGSGLVVARLPNGNWSAPSAICIGGAGVGGQIGGELTDFVMILTTPDAVKAFSHGGNLTLGANVGVAAGPYGRNAEASGAIRNLAPVVSYSRSKGLFIGVSLEGTVIIERKDANKEAYNRPVRPEELLSGSVPPPPSADCLFRALNLRIPPLASSGVGTPADGASIAGTSGPYGAASYYGETSYGSAATFGDAAGPSTSAAGGNNSYLNRSITADSLHSTPGYGAPPSGYDKYEPAPAYDSTMPGTGATDYYSPPTGDAKRRPPPPIPARRPAPEPKDTLPRVVAKYDFAGENDGDLPFKKGDIIKILEHDGNVNSWWKGSCNGREGMVPANFMEETSLEAMELKKKDPGY